jgi:hypothetical protein
MQYPPPPNATTPIVIFPATPLATFVVQIALTVIFVWLAVRTLRKEKPNPEARKWAYGILGFLAGFWLHT